MRFAAIIIVRYKTIAWQIENKSTASKLEYAIKTLTKVKKEELIKKPGLLEEYLGNRIDVEKYKKV